MLTATQRLPFQGSWPRSGLRGLITGRTALSGTCPGRRTRRPYIRWHTPKSCKMPCPANCRKQHIFLPYTSRQVVGAACRPPVGVPGGNAVSRDNPPTPAALFERAAGPRSTIFFIYYLLSIIFFPISRTVSVFPSTVNRTVCPANSSAYTRPGSCW